MVERGFMIRPCELRTLATIARLELAKYKGLVDPLI
jgi:hypothetical protein